MAALCAMRSSSVVTGAVPGTAAGWPSIVRHSQVTQSLCRTERTGSVGPSHQRSQGDGSRSSST